MHSFTEILPPHVVDFLRGKTTAEYATLSAAGVPIDTPTFVFPNAELTTLDIGTGLSYPAKAERARRNPKVGMLLEGTSDQPVISVAGYAAVHDADIQANLIRYLAETIFTPNVDPEVVAWEKTRRRLYYLSRVIVAVAPAHVRWWENRAAMAGPPHEWRAPAGGRFPQSDPKPAGKPSKVPQWPQVSWQDRAEAAMAGGLPGHVTLPDAEGFPIPLRVGAIRRSDNGFGFVMPGGAPWSEGKATLSFAGKEVFVGEIRREGAKGVLDVERALPVLPTVDDRIGANLEAIAKLDDRLAEELARRGLPMPVVPDEPPAPTAGALLRMAASRGLDITNVGAGISK
ncbi:MAG: hypothetical protein P8J20_14270 [Novosphingobium sp.]|nr:hypothetical protein [Novosphingobium sp.]